MSRIVGIDLGTTNSLCSVFEDGVPKLIVNAVGQVLTPSAVGILEDGRVIVGEAALQLQVLQPDRVSARFKRWMGTDRSVTHGGMSFSPQELSSLVLRSLKDDAENYLGAPVEDAVITVPAYFNDHQREATRVAGQLAGWNVRRIVNEPSAAALTYGLLDRSADKKLLVFDLGGGTFDVTLMEVFEGTLEIIATAGESHLGGEDFTDRVAHWALRQCGLQLEIAEAREPLRVARLRVLAEDAKRSMSEVEQVTFRVPHADGTVDDRGTEVTLRRELFAELAQPLADKLMRPLVKVLRDGRASTASIDEVILAGGATRMPLVRLMVRDYFGKEPLCSVDPDEVVVKGAAVQAALIVDDAAVDDVVMTDVCPFTLGVEIVKDFGGRRVDGYYLPVIHRNTTIPVSREEIACTVHANQRRVDLKVYQGESRKVADNLLLGQLEVAGIPPGPAGQEVAIRFSYDINGLLEVEAVVEKTGSKSVATFTHNVKNLDKAGLARAIANLQKLKFYPREDLVNKQLLLFAERVLGQVPPYQRQQLEEAVDFFESALHQSDRTVFGATRDELLQQLSLLDHPFQREEERGG